MKLYHSNSDGGGRTVRRQPVDAGPCSEAHLALTIHIVKAPKKTARSIKPKRAASLGRSPVTGAHVLKPVVKGASISLDDVRRVVRALEPLTLD